MFDPSAVSQAAFADTVAQSQDVFRTVLTGLSEPGRVLPVAAAPQTALGVDPAALAVLLTLADNDTPVWIGGPTNIALTSYLRFHTGAPIVTDPARAQFALIAKTADYLPLDAFDAGTEDFPDRSATLILGVETLRENGPFVLQGPGIPDRRGLAIAGLPQRFAADWAENHAQFPCGVDLILTCGSVLSGLPRSIILEAPCM